MNKSDSERVSSILKSLKFKETNKMINADIVVIIACSVRQSAIDRVYGIFHKTKLKKGAIKILTGCVLENDIKNLTSKFDIIIDITKIPDFAKWLRQGRKELKLIRKQKINDYNPKNVDYFDIIPNQKNNFSTFIPISNGCNQFCSYCAVPYTRGREINRSAKNILNEIKKLDKNVRQIVLLGQTVNSYTNPDKKSDIKDFADLLGKIAKLKKDSWITFESSYPSKFNDKLIKIIAKYKNLSHHIHLPLQSGSDKILRLMNRKYSKFEFIKIVKNIYKHIPDANITTDVIIGFPGETKHDFSETLDVIKKCKITLAYSGLYSPRRGTLSAKKYKDNVSMQEKRKRDKILTDLVAKQSGERNKKYLYQVVKVLITEKNKKGEYLGKMQTYETVRILNAKASDLNKIIDVKITKTLNWRLEGKIIR